jgi:hypothetical protein
VEVELIAGGGDVVFRMVVVMCEEMKNREKLEVGAKWARVDEVTRAREGDKGARVPAGVFFYFFIFLLFLEQGKQKKK